MDPEAKEKSQRTLVVVEGNEVELSKNDIVLKPEDQITKTEILNNYMLYIIIIHLRVQRMIAKYMQLCFQIQKEETKTKYFVQFGIVPYIKEMLIFDIK